MTVQQLIELLQDCDPEAEVRIMTQEGWPFENAVRGVAVREDFAGDDDCECDGDAHDADCPAVGPYADGLAANDVFIVEGMQERYGSKDAWQAARR